MWPTLLRFFRMQNADSFSAKYIFVKVGNIVTCVSSWLISVIKDYPNNNPFWSEDDVFMYSQSNSNGGSSLTVYDL